MADVYGLLTVLRRLVKASLVSPSEADCMMMEITHAL